MRTVPAELYPYQGKYLDLDGHKLHYLDEGSGPAVIMVHGNPSWSLYWRRLVAELSADHRVIVPDHIGMGLSDKPGDDAYAYTLGSRVDDLTRLVDHLGLDDVTVIAHDWGGMISMAWAARHAERVKRLVMLNTAAFHNPKGLKLPPSVWLVRNTPVGALLVRGFNAFSWGATRTCVTRKPMSKSLAAAYTAPYANWSERIATLRFVQDIPLRKGDPGFDIVSETSERLDRFSETPTLLIWGEKDFVFDLAFLEEWERRFPHARVVRYPDCGHYVLEDAPDEIAAEVRSFVDAHPVAPPPETT